MISATWLTELFLLLLALFLKDWHFLSRESQRQAVQRLMVKVWAAGPWVRQCATMLAGGLRVEKLRSFSISVTESRRSGYRPGNDFRSSSDMDQVKVVEMSHVCQSSREPEGRYRWNSLGALPCREK